MTSLAILFVSILAQAVDPAALMREGLALLDKNQNAEAVARFDTCIARAKDEANRLAEGECTRGLARAAQARRDYAAARGFFASAHAILAAIPDHPALGRNYTDRAFLAYVETRWTDVRELYGQSAAAFGAAGMKAEQAMAMRGQTFAQGMPFEERQPVLAQAWLLAQEAKNPRVEALVLHHWGDMLFMQGAYDQSLDRTERAVGLLEQLGDDVSLARALTSVGRLHRTMNASREASEIYRRVLALQEKAGDLAGQAQTHGAIATALASLGAHREALISSERALALAREVGTRAQITFQLGRHAHHLLQVGDHAQALTIAQQAIDADAGSDDQATHLAAKAQALRGLKRYDEAVAAATVALNLTVQIGNPEWETDALVNRADTRRAQGRQDEALRDLEAAATVIEIQRSNLPPSDFMKRGFSDLHQAVLSRTVALIHDAGRVRDAATLAEQARSRAFLDLLADRESAAPAVPIGSTMRGAREEIRSSTVAPAPTAATAHAAAARLDSTLVSYWVDDEATFVWVISPRGEMVSRRIPATRAQLQRLVRRTWSFGAATLARRGSAGDEPLEAPVTAPSDRALAAVTMRGGDPLAPSGHETAAYRELYALLIQPVREALPKGSAALLTIVPHGPLFELSFAALIDPRGRHLLEDYRLHYAPSAATLDFTARRATAAAPSLEYLFIANPATAPNLAKPPLPPLPGADREVAAVSRLVGPTRSTTLTGTSASERAVRDAVGKYRVVHFATHGLVSSDNPFDSFLALAPGTDASTDGKLSASEIHALRLSAELVVLSACRAAGGKISGDGIVGLTRAFFTAGAPSIVAALWDMADESAEHLLPRFYAEWQKTDDKATALRTAQLSMLRDLRAGKLTVKTPFGVMPLPAHPALWANLVLIGEPR